MASLLIIAPLPAVIEIFLAPFLCLLHNPSIQLLPDVLIWALTAQLGIILNFLLDHWSPRTTFREVESHHR